ncbi:MAG TPA: hypothetical protein VFH38_00430 [Jatrophihabitans sp.]|nr:hypothetical protein [Jatrophihabitans sp.]
MVDDYRKRRRAALRSAYNAVRSSPDQRPEALRRLFEAELARGGVTDLTSERIDEMIAVARAPGRAAARLVSLATQIAGVFIGGIRTASRQAWMRSPADAESFDWPADSASYFAAVRRGPDSTPLIELMLSTCQLVGIPEFADLPEPVRLLELWLDRLPAGERGGPTPVHVGSSTLGDIDENGQRIVSAMFARMSAPRLSIEGYLIGADAAAARVVAELPAGV